MPHWTHGPESILAPTTLDTFMDAHWDGAPLIIQDRGADIYSGLLTLDALDALIHESGWLVPTFRLVKEGTQIPHVHYTVDEVPWGTGSVSGFIERERVRQFMKDGATFVMESCQRIHPSIGRLSRSFEQAFHSPSAVNLYVTPPSSQGFQPHFDIQNVFVLQLHGSKQWKVYGPHIEHPVPSQAVHGAVQPGPLLHDITLKPGDLLYLPRGYVHVAHTTQELSAHLSVSMLPTTWADVFTELIQTLPLDSRFRSAIPLQPHGPAEASDAMESTFEELMTAFGSGSDLEDALDGMARRFVATRLPATSGQLQALTNSAAVSLHASLQRHPNIVWRVESDGEQAHLHFHGKTTSVPWTAIQALRSIAEGKPFKVSEIPGELSDDTRCQLAQHLLDEGFLIYC
jgi:bifunctional lysine-specific demethylase and histidyl-hydroxylase NO66